MLSSLHCVWLFATPWTVTLQVPLSMEFSRQEYWRGLSFPPAGDIFDPGIKPTSPLTPALAGRFFITKLPGKPCWVVWVPFIVWILTPFQISCLKIFFPLPYLFLVMLLGFFVFLFVFVFVFFPCRCCLVWCSATWLFLILILCWHVKSKINISKNYAKKSLPYVFL